jgi:hypothetical protein
MILWINIYVKINELERLFGKNKTKKILKQNEKFFKVIHKINNKFKLYGKKYISL